MTGAEAREQFAQARVARLATADPQGQPHLVPVVFAVERDTVYIAVDHKPKRTTALRRLANVRANPRVALLVDHYDDEDWTVLWWVRADGTGRVLEPSDTQAQHAVELLGRRYAQHLAQPPAGPVLVVDVAFWSGWAAQDAAP